MEGLDTPCLLILTESLISANWVGQFKQARQSGVSRERDTGANGQAAVVTPASDAGVTPPADPVNLPDPGPANADVHRARSRPCHRRSDES